MLLLYAKGHTGRVCEPIRGRTRLMKTVFLLKEELLPKMRLKQSLSRDAFPDFSPYDYGPFSSQVFSDLEFLVELGFVSVDPVSDAEPLPEEALEYEYWQAGGDGLEGEEQFSLTSLGREFVEGGEAGHLTPDQWEAFAELKARCNQTPLRALLRYIYAKYPEWTTKSKIREDILSKHPF